MSGWFPLLILLVETNEQRLVKTVNDIPQGTTFRVLQTNYIEDRA